MKTTGLKIALIGLALALQGCMMKPQDIHIDPPVSLGKPGAGADNKVVAVEAHDERPSKVLGTVGRSDSARHADVTSNDDAAPAIYVRVAAGLKSRGFSVKAMTEGDDRVLRVEVVDLKYQTTKGSAVTDVVEVTAKINGRARNKGEWQDRQYTITHKKSVGILPEVEENTRIVNDALAQALNDMLSDPYLVDLLSK